MMFQLRTFYILLGILGIILFVGNYFKLRRLKKTIGCVEAGWSVRMNIGIKYNGFLFAYIFLYCLMMANLFREDPGLNSNILAASVFVLYFGHHYFKWRVEFGTDGIIYHLKSIRNDRILKREIIIEKGRQILSLVIDDSGPSDMERLKIPVPKKYYRKVKSLEIMNKEI